MLDTSIIEYQSSEFANMIPEKNFFENYFALSY